MREILIITRYCWRGVRNDLAQRPAQRAWACLVIVLNLLGAFLAYRGFVVILKGWFSDGDGFLFGSILLLLGILGLAYLLSLVSAAKEFLAQAQTPLFLAAPLKPSSLLWAKYLVVLADRNLELAVVVLGLPCLLAMYRMGLSQAFYLFLPFFASVLLAGMAAVTTVLFVARYAWQRRKLVFGSGVGLLIVLLAWIAWAISISPVDSVPGAALESLQRWAGSFASTPLLMSATLTLAPLLALWGLAWLSGKIYAPAWSRLQETRLVKREQARKPSKPLLHRLPSSWQGTTWAIVLKDWRTMGRSPLFPLRGLGLLSSWGLFLVVRELVDTQDPWLAIPVVVAYVLLSLQATVMELTANAFAGEGNRLSLILTAPLRSKQLVRAKLAAHLVPALVASAVTAAVIGIIGPATTTPVGVHRADSLRHHSRQCHPVGEWKCCCHGHLPWCFGRARRDPLRGNPGGTGRRSQDGLGRSECGFPGTQRCRALAALLVDDGIWPSQWHSLGWVGCSLPDREWCRCFGRTASGSGRPRSSYQMSEQARVSEES